MDAQYTQAIEELTRKIQERRAAYYHWLGVNAGHAAAAFLSWRIVFAARTMLLQGMTDAQLWQITCRSKGVLRTSACSASVALSNHAPKVAYKPRYLVANYWGE
ncbi:MAG: hypothetical protein H0X24_14155 [Ktedonobacterales bacterium]|nr:hypothetical protein [Ktedonobacterales bacterium]